jgi:hypothetical protein
MDEMDALAMMVTSPEKFLKTNVISIVGKSTNGPLKARINKRDQGFRIDCGGFSVNGPQVDVWNFRMIPNSEAINLQNVDHLHIDSSRPQIAVTGKLSGCTVLLSPEGNSIRCAHVQPGGVRPGPNPTQVILEGQAFLGGAPAETSFGPEHYRPENAQTAHVIGFARKSGWEFWAQTCYGASGNQRVVEVRQLT